MQVTQCIHYEGGNHARLLPLYIEQLLQYTRENGLVIEAIALSEGPGSYTGLRIGTSTAKGLCYGLDVPLIPVPTPDILCLAAQERLKKEGIPYSAGTASLVPMIDARRMEVYTKINGETKAVVVENEESLGLSSPSCFYFGDGAEKCQAVLTSPAWHFIPGIVPEAQYLGVLAEGAAAGNHPSVVKGRQLAYYEPFYLKEFIAAQSHVKGLK